LVEEEKGRKIILRLLFIQMDLLSKMDLSVTIMTLSMRSLWRVLRKDTFQRKFGKRMEMKEE